jgi:Epoxide hydrolase N terminus
MVAHRRGLREVRHISKPALTPRPFTIQVPDEVLADLRQRLDRVRWPDEIPVAGWDYGTDLAYMQDLVAYWREAYDWRTHEALLNGFKQYTVPQDHDLLAVISLPVGVFKPSAGGKIGVLVFRKLRADAAAVPKTSNVWFYEVRNDSYDPDKIVGGGRPETHEKNDIPALLQQWKIYKDSGFNDSPGVETAVHGCLPVVRSLAVGGYPLKRSPTTITIWSMVVTSRRWPKARPRRAPLS